MSGIAICRAGLVRGGTVRQRASRAAIAVLVAASARPAGVSAQGITTAAVYGTVTAGSDSAGLPGAVVTIINTTNGERWRVVADASGRYGFDYLAVGGPYTVDARAIGFRPI